MTDATADPTRAVAEFLAGLTIEDIPSDVRASAVRAILDTVGVTLAGSSHRASRIATEQVAAAHGKCRVLGTAHRTTAEAAALANGVAAHVLDYDDRGHSSTHVFPAALAMAEQTGATGQELLVAYIAGREFRMRLSEALDSGRFAGRGSGAHGWHSTGTAGSLAATAAAARVLCLEADDTASALGIAGSLAGGLMANFGTMTKALHAGNAARNGVLAATLAANGFSGEPTIMSARWGFAQALDPDRTFDAAAVASKLTSSFHLSDHGVRIKPYPCCSMAHPYIEEMKRIRADFGVTAEMVERIECTRIDPLIRLFPTTDVECKFSAAYALAVTLLTGTFAEEHCSQDFLSAQATQELLARTAYIETDRPGITVRIYLASGQVIERQLSRQAADLTEEAEIEAKFLACAAPVVGDEQAARIRELVVGLADLPDARTLSLACSTADPEISAAAQ